MTTSTYIYLYIIILILKLLVMMWFLSRSLFIIHIHIIQCWSCASDKIPHFNVIAGSAIIISYIISVMESLSWWKRQHTSSPCGESKENIVPSPLSERQHSQFFLWFGKHCCCCYFCKNMNDWKTCQNSPSPHERGVWTWCRSRWGRAGGFPRWSPPCLQSPWVLGMRICTGAESQLS